MCFPLFLFYFFSFCFSFLSFFIFILLLLLLSVVELNTYRKLPMPLGTIGEAVVSNVKKGRAAVARLAFEIHLLVC